MSRLARGGAQPNLAEEALVERAQLEDARVVGGGERRALVCFGSVPLASLGVDEARFFRVVRRAVESARRAI